MFREPDSAGPPPAAGDATPSPPANCWERHLAAGGWGRFSAEDHQVWDMLFSRQLPYLGSRIVSPFLDGLAALGLDRPGIPCLDRLNDRLFRLTGWRCLAVPGLVPDDAFFAMLANRLFPVGNFIRPATALDYLEEPDCFHDIFGHVPMLAHAPMARLIEQLGRLGVAAIGSGHGEVISRLYWHTVEFGLACEGDAVKILGAGLASSFGEAHYAIEADVPRPRFTAPAAAACPYRSDAFQPLYFVSDSLESTSRELEALTLGDLAGLAG